MTPNSDPASGAAPEDDNSMADAVSRYLKTLTPEQMEDLLKRANFDHWNKAGLVRAPVNQYEGISAKEAIEAAIDSETSALRQAHAEQLALLRAEVVGVLESVRAELIEAGDRQGITTLVPHTSIYKRVDAALRSLKK